MKLKKLFTALFLVLLLFAGTFPAMAEDPVEPPAIPGTVEGTGTAFEITDSEYLNVTLQSSVPITLQLESVPSTVMMFLEPVEEIPTAQMTVGGLVPSTTYYMYEDNYHNKEAITTDSSGSYTWVQDLSASQQVWIQPNPSTKFINDTGGDCASIGTWDDSIKTCTLTMDVYETIQIDSDDVTLDGNGYVVRGVGSGIGIYLRNRTGVTIKNIVVEIFTDGMLISSGGYNILTGNTASNNEKGIRFQVSYNNTLTGNTASNNRGNGIHIASGGYNILSGNTVSDNNTNGIYLYSSINNTLLDNTAWNNSYGIDLYNGTGNTLTGNTASNNNYGIYFYSGENQTLTSNTATNNYYGLYLYKITVYTFYNQYTQIYNNSFIDNTHQAYAKYCDTGDGIVFNLAGGGNHWSNYNEPDANGDGYVDMPYVIPGSNKLKDYFPLAPVDDESPIILNIMVDPNEVIVGSQVALSATVDDTGQGDSVISSAEYSLFDKNGAVIETNSMYAEDDSWDTPTEDVYYNLSAPLSAGVYDLCVRGTDASDNMSEPECNILTVYDPDNEAPNILNIMAESSLVIVGNEATLFAIVNDSASGNSVILSAECSLFDKNGDVIDTNLMYPEDGSWDTPTEDVSCDLPAPISAGVYDLCVRGTDASDNMSEQECTILVVYDPEGGFVTGGGWILSPAGAYNADLNLIGKANFGFISKYKKGANVPSGNTQFIFKTGDLNFYSNEYDWLVVNQGGTNAQFKGVGTINGEGGYKFMIWASDNEEDTFRIKVWYENNGSEEVVYDNGFDQVISGGNIVVHTQKK